MSNEPTYRLMPFPLWALTYTPVIPKAYWDVLSQEESIKNLWREFDKVRAYINYAYEEMDKLAQELADQLDTAKEALAEAQATLENAIAIKAEIEALRDECESIRQQAIQDLDTLKREAENYLQEQIDQASITFRATVDYADRAFQDNISEMEDILTNTQEVRDEVRSIADGLQSFIDDTTARLTEIETLVNGYNARITALENQPQDTLVYAGPAHISSSLLQIDNVPQTANAFTIYYTVNGQNTGNNTPLKSVEVIATDNKSQFVALDGSYYALDGCIQLRTSTLTVTYERSQRQLAMLSGRGGYANLYMSQNTITGETGNPYTQSNIYIQKVVAKTVQPPLT